MGKHAKCIEVLDEAFKDFNEIFEDEDNLIKGHLLNNLGMSLKKNGEFEEAERNYLKCLMIREKGMAEHHPEIIAIKHNLSELYFAMGNKEKSAQFAEEVKKHMES